MAIVVASGSMFRAAVLIGFNLSQFAEGAIAQFVLYSLFYTISEIMPIITGLYFVFFRGVGGS
jgi:hypothetical protein